MNRRQCTKFSQRLTKVLGKGTITRLGRTTGFTHRLREVPPHRLAIALLTSLSCHSTQTLADILRVFNALTDRSGAVQTVSQPTGEARLFHLHVAPLRPAPGSPRAPRAGAAARSCAATLRRHPAARREFVRGRGRPAGHFARAVHEDQPRRRGTACHDEPLPRPGHSGPLGTGCRRRAPVSTGTRRPAPQADPRRSGVYCRHVHHAGGSFIVRFKTGVNPVVVRARVGGRERVSWCGKQLVAVRDRLRGTSADLLVRWTHDDPPLRLLLIWNRSMRAHMALVTKSASSPT